MERFRLPHRFAILVAIMVAAHGSVASLDRCAAQPVTLHEGPGYDGVQGYLNPSFHQNDPVSKPQASWALLSNAGTASWFADLVPSTADFHALRFSPPVGPAVQLSDLAGPPVAARSAPFAINAEGAIVGRSRDANGRERPVRWNAAGTVATLLQPLEFFEPLGPPEGQANDINDAGITVGWNGKTHHEFIAILGNRAVRWNAAGEPTELANISSYTVDSGMGEFSVATSEAYAINNAGVAVGYGNIYSATGVSMGHRAIRWSADGLAAELGNLGTSLTGATNSEAWAVNEAGDAVGFATKFDVQGLNDGQRAVRWSAGSPTPVELGILGTNAMGVTISKAITLNEEGTAVGWVDKYGAEGAAQGARAAVWNPAGEIAELGLLPGANFSRAFDINESGLAAGTSGETSAPLAVYWEADGTPIDLNTLIAPDSGWVLQQALAISDTGWIAGIGKFDDGAGGVVGTYDRVFMLQLPTAISLPGDYNSNGSVDAADYVAWRATLDSDTTLPNDTTPGTVTQADYDVWRANFGAMAPQAAGLAAGGQVPEPSTVSLAVLSLMLIARIRRRRVDKV